MPTVVVKNHVVDPETRETFLRGIYKVDEAQAYRLTSTHPDDVEEQDTSATPAAADLAADNDINLDDVKGTGTDGKVIKQDVEEVLAEREPPEETPPA